MNPKRQLIIDGLEESGFTYSKPNFSRPEMDRYMLFSKPMSAPYLVSFHDKFSYNGGLDNFKADIKITRRQGLNPLPIFDSDIFFRPDRGKQEFRASSSTDRRKLFGLELITNELFGRVTYVSDYGLFVVDYGDEIGTYYNARVKGQIPTSGFQVGLKTIKVVQVKAHYPFFGLSFSNGLGQIVMHFIAEESGDEIRGQQILDSQGDDDDLTWGELCDVKAAIERDRS